MWVSPFTIWSRVSARNLTFRCCLFFVKEIRGTGKKLPGSFFGLPSMFAEPMG